MGKELKNTFLEAGFTDVWAFASFDYFSTAEDVAFLRAFIDDWFYSPRVIEAAVQFGLATESSSPSGVRAWTIGATIPGPLAPSPLARL